MKGEKMKIGIIGGTFDPIHNGHLYIARKAMEEFSLAKVIFMPTGISYMKQASSGAQHRYEMTRLAIKDYEGFEISDLEVFRGGNTYTCETIAELKEIYPNDKLYFIIGTDTLFMMEKWKNYEYIFQNVTLIVADRQGENEGDQKEKAEFLKKEYGAKIKFLDAKKYNLSATLLRAAFKIKSPEYRISIDCPDGVIRYAQENHLYDGTPMKDTEILELLKLDLKPKRITHTLGVMDTAVRLAQIHGCDEKKARTAALLHDCAKYLSLEEKLKLCYEFRYPVSELERNNPELLHAKAGAALANKKYGFDDSEIEDAVYYHTTGKPEMSVLTQIIFISDYIEPGRNHSPKLNDFRRIAESDLDKCTACILEETLLYLESRPNNKIKAVDPTTRQAYEYYKVFLN